MVMLMDVLQNCYMYHINLLEFVCRKRVVDTMCADMRQLCLELFPDIPD